MLAIYSLTLWSNQVIEVWSAVAENHPSIPTSLIFMTSPEFTVSRSESVFRLQGLQALIFLIALLSPSTVRPFSVAVLACSVWMVPVWIQSHYGSRSTDWIRHDTVLCIGGVAMERDRARGVVQSYEVNDNLKSKTAEIWHILHSFM